MFLVALSVAVMMVIVMMMVTIVVIALIIIVITLVLDEKGRSLAPAAIATEGIAEPVKDAIRKTVEEHIARAGKRVDADELSETVRRAARRAANDAWGKKPITRVTVVEV